MGESLAQLAMRLASEDTLQQLRSLITVSLDDTHATTFIPCVVKHKHDFRYTLQRRAQGHVHAAQGYTLA